MEQNNFLKAKEQGLLAFAFFGGFFFYGLFLISVIFGKNNNIVLACGLLIIVSFILFLVYAFKSFGLIQSHTNAPVKTLFLRAVLVVAFCFIILLGFVIANSDVLESKDMILLAEFKNNLEKLTLFLFIPVLYAIYLYLRIYYILHKISGEKLFLIYVHYQIALSIIGFFAGLFHITIPGLVEIIIGFISVCILYAAWKSVEKFNKIE